MGGREAAPPPTERRLWGTCSGHMRGAMRQLVVAVHATREDKSRRGCRACALAGGLNRDPRAPTHLVIFLSPPLVLRRCGRVAARPATVIGRGAAAFLWRRRRFGRGPADAADHRRARRAAVARGQWRGVGLEAGRGWRATAGAVKGQRQAAFLVVSQPYG